MLCQPLELLVRQLAGIAPLGNDEKRRGSDLELAGGREQRGGLHVGDLRQGGGKVALGPVEAVEADNSPGAGPRHFVPQRGGQPLIRPGYVAWFLSVAGGPKG